jgi:dATP pyrophosphohydrolase
MNIRADIIECFVIRQIPSGHEFLQLRRSSGDYMGGSWQTIMGSIEPGETAIAAALRELKEEAGLVPADLFQLDQVSTFFIAARDSIFHCPQFCAIVPQNCVITLNEEHDAFRWIPAQTAADHFFWPGDKRGVAEILTQILTNSPAFAHMRILPPSGRWL